MMIYNDLYTDKQQRTGRRNGQHSGGRGFVQTSRATRMARNNGQIFARCQSWLHYAIFKLHAHSLSVYIIFGPNWHLL